MHCIKSALIVVLPLFLAAPACRSTGTDMPLPVVGAGQGSPPDHGPRAAELRRREAARAVEQLDALIAVDRQAVEGGEQRVAQMHGLFEAGRATSPELRAAELQLVELRQTLARHEQELADARRATAADEPDAARARNP